MPTPAPDPGPPQSVVRRLVAALVTQALRRSTGPSLEERRRQARRPARLEARTVVRLGTAGPATNVALALLDLSANGAGLRLRTPVRPGESAHVAVWPSDGRAPIRRWAAVIWCREAPGGTFRAGVAFRRPLTPDDLHFLGQEPDPNLS